MDQVDEKLNGLFKAWSELWVRIWGGLGLRLGLDNNFLISFPFYNTIIPSQVVTISRILTPLTVTRFLLTPGAGATSGWAAGEQTSFMKMQKNKN